MPLTNDQMKQRMYEVFGPGSISAQKSPIFNISGDHQKPVQPFLSSCGHQSHQSTNSYTGSYTPPQDRGVVSSWRRSS